MTDADLLFSNVRLATMENGYGERHDRLGMRDQGRLAIDLQGHAVAVDQR